MAFSVENGDVKLARAHYTVEGVAGSVGPPTVTKDIDRMIEAAKEERAGRMRRKLGS